MQKRKGEFSSNYINKKGSLKNLQFFHQSSINTIFYSKSENGNQINHEQQEVVVLM